MYNKSNGLFGFSGCDDVSSITNYVFALTGATWSVIRTHFPDLIPRIATRGAVFSRMSPDQKQQLIQSLQALGYYVGKIFANQLIKIQLKTKVLRFKLQCKSYCRLAALKN